MKPPQNKNKANKTKNPNKVKQKIMSKYPKPVKSCAFKDALSQRAYIGEDWLAVLFHPQILSRL